MFGAWVTVNDKSWGNGGEEMEITRLGVGV